MPRIAALYCRVSTMSQSCEAQKLELLEVAARSGWQVVEVYADQGISGTKGRRDRPGLDRLLKDVSRRRFDLVAVTGIDRLGRSLPDLLAILAELHASNIDLFVRREGWDTSSPSGRAMFALMGIFAEFERNLIRERVLAGLSRARSQGKVLGRPRMPAEKTRAIRFALEAGGQSLRQIAAQHRVGLGTVQRMKASMPGGLLGPTVGRCVDEGSARARVRTRDLAREVVQTIRVEQDRSKDSNCTPKLGCGMGMSALTFPAVQGPVAGNDWPLFVTDPVPRARS